VKLVDARVDRRPIILPMGVEEKFAKMNLAQSIEVGVTQQMKAGTRESCSGAGI